MICGWHVANRWYFPCGEWQGASTWIPCVVKAPQTRFFFGSILTGVVWKQHIDHWFFFKKILWIFMIFFVIRLVGEARCTENMMEKSITNSHMLYLLNNSYIIGGFPVFYCNRIAIRVYCEMNRMREDKLIYTEGRSNTNRLKRQTRELILVPRMGDYDNS